MDVLFHVNSLEEEIETKINLDELYDRKQQRDLNTLSSYNKILNRIHTKVRTVSRNQINEQFCWYIVPEMMIGIPKFDHGACVAYIMDKLRDNGFIVRYTHPNLLFVSWQHWVPDYVRTEIKKKTGVVVDGHGTIIKHDEEEKAGLNPNAILKNMKQSTSASNQNPNIKAIETYKPTGQLIYNNDILDALKNNLKK